MRKLLLFLMIFFCVGISAQQKKQVVRKSATNTEEHMTFMGVPINGSISSFVNKLSAKGIKMPAALGKHFFKINGKKAQIELNNENGLCIVDLYTNYLSVDFNKFDYYNNLVHQNIEKKCREIEKKYRYKKYYYKTCEYLYESETDENVVYSIYSSNNPSKKIGDIAIETVWGNGEVCILLSYYDYANNVKYNKDNYAYCNSDIEWSGSIYSAEKFTMEYGIEKNIGNVFIKHYTSNQIYNYILTGEDKHLFCNLMFTCKNENTRNYFLSNFLSYASKEVKNINKTYIFCDVIKNQIKDYYAEIERKRQERERQLAQRKQSFGFMDIMHMLAPGFFTQDDVDLWNKLPEENQRAIISGSFGLFGSTSDTHGHTEKMHTPSLRNSE